MDYKRFFAVLAMTVALTTTIAATSMTVGSSNKAFADLPPQAIGHASDQGAANGQAPPQAGNGGTCPPERGIPCR
jgi:hypothetical protein